jgi:Flp pilus assembly protein TadD
MRDLDSRHAAREWWRAAVPALLVGAAAVVYWNSLPIPFLYDDQTSVVGNQSIRTLAASLSPPPHGAPVSGRPLVNVTLAINYAAVGLDPHGYHAVNLLIHVSCALLLFGIVRRTVRETPVAAAAALLWLVHPLASEAVDYVSARTESLMALCYLSTLYAHVRARTARRPMAWNALSVAACAAGMACKESMVTAPLLVILYDAIFTDAIIHEETRSSRSRRLRQPDTSPTTAQWGYYAALASTWIVAAILVAANPRAGSAGFSVDPGLAPPISVWTYLLNQTVMIVRYLHLAFWPRHLVLDYGLPQPMTLASAAPYAAVCVALLAATVVALVRFPGLGFLGASFFLTLAPSSSVIPIATEVGAERRMYLPLMAVTVLASIALIQLRRKAASRPSGAGRQSAVDSGSTFADGLTTATIALVCTALGVQTFHRNTEYRTPRSLWQTVIDRRPHGRARYNLAMALKAEGRRAEALAQLRDAVSDYPEAHYSLGAELVAEGRSDEAIPHFEQFIRERPSHIAVLAAWTDLGIAYATRSDMPHAVKAFEQVVTMTPRNANARRNLANALLETRDFEGAIAQAQAGLALNANDAVSREILEMALAGSRATGSGR